MSGLQTMSLLAGTALTTATVGSLSTTVGSLSTIASGLSYSDFNNSLSTIYSGTSTISFGLQHATHLGTSGNDVIVGTSGADAIWGGAGNDTMTGGYNVGPSGNWWDSGYLENSFQLYKGSGKDLITDTNSDMIGQYGVINDGIRFSDVTSSEITMTTDGNNITIHYGASDSVTVFYPTNATRDLCTTRHSETL